jgi:hypothetical protein
MPLVGGRAFACRLVIPRAPPALAPHLRRNRRQPEGREAEQQLDCGRPLAEWPAMTTARTLPREPFRTLPKSGVR